MINRVNKLLEIEHLSPSQFADEINLQRSSLSHVLSGRNKPSLDFVMKIKQRFSEVNLDWLIFGDGNMFASHQVNDDAKSVSVKDEIKYEENQQSINFDSKSISSVTAKDTENEKVTPTIEPIKVKSQSGRSSKVIIFYDNGTFDEYVSK